MKYMHVKRMIRAQNEWKIGPTAALMFCMFGVLWVLVCALAPIVE